MRLREEFAFLGLGSNLGDRLGYLQDAVDLLELDARTRVDAVSGVYETEPVGGPEQGPYLNMAVRVATRRSPHRLLGVCARIESRLGRARPGQGGGQRWGPRTVDLDILLYGRRRVRRPDLVIPHPRLCERAFALIPLIEVAPGMALPDGTSLAAALARLAPVQGVR
ncbi:MAG: 2-amino-4-hydroxy-6-hydroxymethyldihydropteridine diphosphokinase, partial [Actinomycetota bacterium]|nr:2-amino-4-hydroxy-6-hydroxymethyldihydropteridine diphosphokinase [Actinomycetota bacterium]